MKKSFAIVLVLVSFIMNAQEQASVEDRLFGVQLGVVNASFQYEIKLDRKITLLSELGLSGNVSTRDYVDPAIEDETVYIIAPYITFEPRWYHGLDRREKLGRNTHHNSSNYVSLATSFFSNRTPIVHSGNFNIVSAIYIIPKYGIRRAFAKNFNYEFSAGYGYQYNIFSKKQGCNCDHNNVAIDIQARIGYNF